MYQTEYNKSWKIYDGKSHHSKSHNKHNKKHTVIIPEEDRFVPFALTIKVGDTVEWINNDTDPHTVVSDDAVNVISPKGVNQLIPSGQSFRIRFNEPGQWVYFCRFHAHLDAFNQPIAPGCGADGTQVSGIATPLFPCSLNSVANNFGTPMMGVITILSRRKHH